MPSKEDGDEKKASGKAFMLVNVNILHVASRHNRRTIARSWIHREAINDFPVTDVQGEGGEGCRVQRPRATSGELEDLVSTTHVAVIGEYESI